jgi:hypothetical protein
MTVTVTELKLPVETQEAERGSTVEGWISLLLNQTIEVEWSIGTATGDRSSKV